VPIPGYDSQHSQSYALGKEKSAARRGAICEAQKAAPIFAKLRESANRIAILHLAKTFSMLEAVVSGAQRGFIQLEHTSFA